MPLKYEDISGFARDNGDVTGWAKKGAVTLLKNGGVDTIRFWEKDVIVFCWSGNSYTKKEFEQLILGKKRN